MKLTNAADVMIQKLGHIHTTEYLATVIGLAERFAKANGMTRVATVHIEAAMERMTDPMAPDYPALAAEDARIVAAEDARIVAAVAAWHEERLDTQEAEGQTVIAKPKKPIVVHYYTGGAPREPDPMAPDYDALAAEEPTSQNGDSRDSAEVAG